MRFFTLDFLHGSVSPKPLIIPVGINSRRYSQFKVHHRCQQHRWQMEKIFNQKNFGTGFVYTGGKFASDVVDTGGNLPPTSLTLVANLPPVLLTPVVHLDL
jgi:hypothetical protein